MKVKIFIIQTAASGATRMKEEEINKFLSGGVTVHQMLQSEANGSTVITICYGTPTGALDPRFELPNAT